MHEGPLAGREPHRCHGQLPPPDERRELSWHLLVSRKLSNTHTNTSKRRLKTIALRVVSSN